MTHDRPVGRRMTPYSRSAASLETTPSHTSAKTRSGSRASGSPYPPPPGGIEPQGVFSPQGIIRVARRQALGRRTLRVDPDIAGTSGSAAGAAVWRDRMLHRADGEAGIGEIEIFAADAEPAAEFAYAA